MSTIAADEIKTQAAASTQHFTKVISVRVRELGPVVRLLSSVALVEGGTEVLLEISEFTAGGEERLREFTVRWTNGGAGVLKGVASLPEDMNAAIQAAMQPSPSTR